MFHGPLKLHCGRESVLKDSKSDLVPDIDRDSEKSFKVPLGPEFWYSIFLHF